MKSLLIIFCLFTHLSFGQVRHTATLDYSGVYFWGSGDPFGFQEMPGSYGLPSVSYKMQLRNWGITASFIQYFNGYRHVGLSRLETSNTGIHRLSVSYRAIGLSTSYRIYRQKNMELFTTAGPYLQLNGETKDYEFDHAYKELYLYPVFNYRRFGVNAGLLAQYIFWKGFTFQTSLTQTRLFKAATQQNMTNLRLGLGYTFGGGINRPPKRKSAP